MDGKVAIITGATSMMGRACAQTFAKQGVKLMLVGRSKDKLEELAQELPGTVAIRAVDARCETEIKAMVQDTVSAFQQIDVVIQNVAIYPWKCIEELTLQEWQETLDVNLTSAFLTTQAAFSEMKKRRKGKFIFLSSIVGEKIGMPSMSSFAASKAGLNGFMRSAALEFSRYNINVNSISPGKMYDESTLSKEEHQKKLRPVPLNRFTPPNDIAEMALFLASDRGNNITGQNFILDGGQSILGEEAHLSF